MPPAVVAGCDVLRRTNSFRASLERTLLVAALLLAAASLSPAARAQDWPTRPVTVVFPYGPGGGDVITRAVMEKVGNRLGQRFVLENRPGAGGVIGTSEVARAAPDGYKLIVASLGSMILAPVFNGGTPPFDAIRGFAHIAMFGGPPAALVVSASSPSRDLQQFVALSKAQKDGFSYGSPGRGSLAHLAGELFQQRSGANMTHVPYKEAPRALADIAGGQISAAFLSTAAVLPLVQSGQVRMLAVSAERRIDEFPDVPTFIEAGHKDLIASTWFGLSGPSGLPHDIVRQLNVEVRAALTQPDVQGLLRNLGAELKDLDADGFSRFVAAEATRWEAIARPVAASTQQ
jgi:tripartite-type tricarboxylate transporter receptor subunit TctC